MQRNIVIVTIIICLSVFGCASPRISRTGGLDPITQRMVASVELNQQISGSGFFVMTEDGQYFVTAKHVLFSEDGTLISKKARLISLDVLYNFMPSRNKQTSLDLDLDLLASNKSILFNAGRDVVVIKIAEMVKDGRVKFRALKPIAGVTSHENVSGAASIGATPEMFTYYKDVYISDDIFVLGYPAAIGLKNIPQIDFSSPLIRKGIIAGKNDNLRTIIIDCLVNHGNSGGSVIALHNKDGAVSYSIIGIVIQFVPSVEPALVLQKKGKGEGDINVFSLANSGYAVVLPIDSIMDVLNKNR